MAERASLFNKTQIGVEVTPGTAVPATKQLTAISIEPSIDSTVDVFTPAGAKFATMAIPGKETTKGTASGKLTYTEVVYVLAAFLGDPVPTQITPTTGIAYSRIYEPEQSDPDDVKSLTIEQGSSVRGQRFALGQFTEFGYTFDREKVDITGAVMGQALEDNFTLTPALPAVELVPVNPKHISVYLDDDSAELGTTKMLRVLSGEFSFADRFGAVWTVDRDQDSYAATAETKPTTTFKMMVEADAQGMALLPVMRNGSKRFIRFEAIGPNIEAGNDYSFIHDMCGVVSDVGEFSDRDGVYAIEWTFTIAQDDTWGKNQSLEVINKISAL